MTAIALWHPHAGAALDRDFLTDPDAADLISNAGSAPRLSPIEATRSRVLSGA
jgi:hypothetical protein